MERLLEELAGRGELDPGQVDWARAHYAEHGGSLDTVLLELDLIDEASLLRALGIRFKKRVATPKDLATIDPELTKRLPESFGKSFFMCPLRLVGGELVALVQRPLEPDQLQELGDLFGLKVRELVAPAHYLTLARASAYGTSLDPESEELERRLVRRREAPDLAFVAANMASADSLMASFEELLRFAESRLEFACLLVLRKGRLRVIGARSNENKTLSEPKPSCCLRPALLHGGYFLGPPGCTPDDLDFFQELGRSLPERAFAAPVPSTRDSRVVLYADNGRRGIATRWVAELTVLAGRLGHPSGRREAEPAAEREPATPVGAPSLPAPEDVHVLERLRSAAREARMELRDFVEELLARRTEAPREDAGSTALVGEMKTLFERLATDIPAHLARGMEAAFRDLAPRLAPAPPLTNPRERPAVAVDLVQTNAAPREVASYASRRQKTERLKL